jgi:hypothetical protein
VSSAPALANLELDVVVVQGDHTLCLRARLDDSRIPQIVALVEAQTLGAHQRRFMRVLGHANNCSHAPTGRV